MRWLAGLALAASASLAAAQPSMPPEQASAAAHDHASTAKQHFDRGEYQEAIADYREAYRLLPSPPILYNLAQAYRLAGDCAGAVRAYEEFLKLVPTTQYRSVAENNLAAARQCVQAVPPPTPEHIPATSPPAEPPLAEPPPAEVSSTIERRPETPPDHARVRTFGLAIGAVGLAIIGAGTYLALDARNAARQVSQFYATGGSWGDIETVDARGHRESSFAIASFAAGGAVAVAGALMAVLGGHSDHRDLAIAPPDRGRGIDVVATWRY